MTEKPNMKFLPRRYQDAAERQRRADEYRDALVKSEQIADPVERLDALLNAKQCADVYAQNMILNCGERAKNIAGFAGVGFIVAAAGLSWAAMLATPLLGLAVLCGAAAGFSKVTGDASEWVDKRMNAELGGHPQDVLGTVLKMRESIGETLKNSSVAIAASEKFGALYDRFPEIRDSFVKSFTFAAARREAATQQPPAPKAPASVAGGPT